MSGEGGGGGDIAGAIASLGGAWLGSDAAKEAAKAQERAAQQALGLQQQQYMTGLAMNEPWRATGQGALNSLARLYGLPYQDYQSATDTAQQYTNTGQQLGAKAVARMLKQGMSVADIAKTGTLFLQSPKRMGALTKRGLSGDDISMLQRGPSQFAQAPAMNNLPGAGQGQAGPDMSVFTTSPDYQFRRDEGMRGIEQGAAARGGALSGNALRAAMGFNSNMASTEFGNFYNRMANMAGIGQAATQQNIGAGQSYGVNAGNAMMNAGAARASGVMGQANSWGNALSGLGSAAAGWYENRNRGSGATSSGGGYGPGHRPSFPSIYDNPQPWGYQYGS